MTEFAIGFLSLSILDPFHLLEAGLNWVFEFGKGGRPPEFIIENVKDLKVKIAYK